MLLVNVAAECESVLVANLYYYVMFSGFYFHPEVESDLAFTFNQCVAPV